MTSEQDNLPFDKAGARLRKILAALALLGLLVGTAHSGAGAQRSGKPLAKEDVIGLLEGDVPPDRVAQVARDQGITFSMTRAAEKELRDAGADDNLIEVLRGLAPKPAAPPHSEEPAASPRSSGPPVLMIEAQPGNAQVYIDDEPLGTTSSEGRLKLSRLSAGAHHIRLSLTGYQDYEQDVTLQGGQTTNVNATLVARRAAQPPSQTGTPPAGEKDPATMGLKMSRTLPADGKGVTVSEVLPGGPADKAGLRAGYALYGINGRRITSPREVQEALGTLRPGDVAEVTYSDGTAVRRTSVHLVARSALPPSEASQGASGSTSTPQTMPGTPSAPVVTFLVEHDHGQTGRTYCVGMMVIGNGRLQYRTTNGQHSFDVALSDIREVKRNAVYLAALGAFHVRLKKGTNNNFVVVNAQGLAQPPDPLLDAVDRAMSQR